MPFAIIQKCARATAETVHEQIQIPIAVEISEHAAGRELIWASDARFGGDVLELPIAEISIEHIVPFKAAEINVHPTIAIDIAEGHAGANFAQSVGCDRRIRQPVAESDSGL